MRAKHTFPALLAIFFAICPSAWASAPISQTPDSALNVLIGAGLILGACLAKRVSN
jgi:hypothetical protein